MKYRIQKKDIENIKSLSLNILSLKTISLYHKPHRPEYCPTQEGTQTTDDSNEKGAEN